MRKMILVEKIIASCVLMTENLLMLQGLFVDLFLM